MSATLRCSLLAALLCLGSTSLAQADEDKRPLPDYDGRGGAPQTPGQKALWVPRQIGRASGRERVFVGV